MSQPEQREASRQKRSLQVFWMIIAATTTATIATTILCQSIAYMSNSVRW